MIFMMQEFLIKINSNKLYFNLNIDYENGKIILKI